MKKRQDKAVVDSTKGGSECQMLSRRCFISRLASTGGVLVCAGGGLLGRETISNVRVAAELTDDPGYARILRNQTFHQWDSFCVPESGKGEVRRLKWMRENPRRGPAVLRLAIALDAIHPGRLEVFLPDSGKAVGGISFQRLGAYQMLEFSLSGLVARQAYSEGLGLRMVSGDAPLWIIGGSARADGNLSPMYLPHLFYAGESSGRSQLIERLQSAQMMAEFGRPLGCVLDGMVQLHRRMPSLLPDASIRKQWTP
ncbi:MAG TPA: hypothetical protein VK968_03165, partial [Roseimicrobium sp.]|nr:hypothetical protein [Roseimicrobium sp.]